VVLDMDHHPEEPLFVIPQGTASIGGHDAHR